MHCNLFVAIMHQMAYGRSIKIQRCSGIVRRLNVTGPYIICIIYRCLHGHGNPNINVYIIRSGPSKQSPLKILEKRECGRIQIETAQFLGTPYYLRNGKSYELQIWPEQ